MCFEIFTIKFPLNKIFYYLEVTLFTFKIVLFIMSVFFSPLCWFTCSLVQLIDAQFWLN